jgi:hypothetical protein
VTRRPAVTWATGVSLALVLGSGLVALGAGAFAEPPVDRAGSFAAINARFAPTSTAARATKPPRTAPRGAHADALRPPAETPYSRPAPASASSVAPAIRHEGEPYPATMRRAGTTTTASDDAHESPARETHEREAPEPERDD